MTAIILLNWNGVEDTLACLQSLCSVQGDFFVTIVDNHSSDNSLLSFQEWKASHPDFPLHLLPEKENHGFARGNNIGVHFASQFHPEYYLLLNNDTEVEPDFLTNLLDFRQKHPKFKILTPRINYFYDKSKVWLCGGHLKFGSRSKLYQDQFDSDIKEQEFIPVTFVSGCALFATADLLQSDGNLLTERFFFGEEDFEFALRMQQQGNLMACVLDSKIYHKVGASRTKIQDNKNIGKDYCFYLGKLICCRLFYHPAKFALLMGLQLPKTLLQFRSSTKSWKQAFAITRKLQKDAYQKEGISKEDFLQLTRTHLV